MTPVIHIVTDQNGPRLQYTLDLIFNEHLNIAYEVHENDNYLPSENLKIYYHSSLQKRKESERTHIHIYKHPLLTENVIYAQNIEVINEKERPYFFQSFAFDGDYHFDIFSMIFYLVSRYEEYLRFQTDEHGRFSSKQSLAHRNKFLDIPLLDLWILHLKEKIEEKWKIKIDLSRTFSIVPTFDIDTPYAYSNRPIHIHFATVLRDIVLLRGKRLRNRLLTLIGNRKDTFDTYDHIFNLLKEHKQNVLFFFLMQNKMPHDQNFSLASRSFRKLVKKISGEFKIGIHPSLSAQRATTLWNEEKKKLENYSDKRIIRSRQHFLHLQFPRTYQHLVSIGIANDYSMIFHDQIGFRASTAVPFYWYDLKNEKATKLKIHPAMLMDATLRHHMKTSPQKAIILVQKMKQTVQLVEGEFTFIWHNSSFSSDYGWEGWTAILEECIK